MVTFLANSVDHCFRTSWHVKYSESESSTPHSSTVGVLDNLHLVWYRCLYIILGHIKAWSAGSLYVTYPTPLTYSPQQPFLRVYAFCPHRFFFFFSHTRPLNNAIPEACHYVRRLDVCFAGRDGNPQTQPDPRALETTNTQARDVEA